MATTCIFTEKSGSWVLRLCTQVRAAQQRGEGPPPFRLALVCVGGGREREENRLLKAGFGQARVATTRQQEWENGEHEGGAKQERKPGAHKASLSAQGSGMEKDPGPRCLGPPWTPNRARLSQHSSPFPRLSVPTLGRGGGGTELGAPRAYL